uniref:Ovule protein n=1 Tax=Panagrolaimus sp. PS1159 TaxID=55785 RepID=A0AC35FFW4_9BILA
MVFQYKIQMISLKSKKQQKIKKTKRREDIFIQNMKKILVATSKTHENYSKRSCSNTLNFIRDNHRIIFTNFFTFHGFIIK